MTAQPISVKDTEFIKLLAKTIRGLSMDGVQAANSGHPGLPLGMADVAATLWLKHLRHNPKDPHWHNRDRFVLSAGHGSMLVYSLLHLHGYDLSLDELRNFRQWGSLTPGHPEHGLTAGVETTTGPLGQGISTAVGMAIAERWMAEKFNRPGHEIVNHNTYVIASDGDLMEGVSHEASSLAGHLKLKNLIVLYDDNSISIDGDTALAFSENVLKRYEAYGWATAQVDGHDLNAINAAITNAKNSDDRPTIIACKTVIGFGSPNRAGTAKAHGEPLGAEELALTKAELGIPASPTFFIPEGMKDYKDIVEVHGDSYQLEWQENFRAYEKAFPQEAAEYQQMTSGKLPSDWEKHLPTFSTDTAMATRKASGAVLDAIFNHVPGLIGGSADLTGSNNTRPKGEAHLTPEAFAGRYVHYGVREHGMGAIMNGIALHGEFIPYGGTFLVFSDYMRGSIRLAALMEQQVVFVFTHDSIGLGEDGPTHQPIEHLNALRAIPNLMVIRPAEANETAGAWKASLEHTHGPTALVLTRQGLNSFDPAVATADAVCKGAYAIVDSASPDVILIGTGSETHIAVDAAKLLEAEGIKARVISMPSVELFEAQPAAYREELLPPSVKARVAIEAGVTNGWYKYVGDSGEVIGLDRFGASAPYKTIYENLGLTAENMAVAAKRSIEKAGK